MGYNPTGYGPDAAEDELGINLVWDWNLSELSTLTTQLSVKTTSDFNPDAGGQKYLNNRTFEAQVRYTSTLYAGNVFNAGFQFLSNRSTQSPAIGTPADGTVVPVLNTFNNQPFTNSGSVPITIETAFGPKTVLPADPTTGELGIIPILAFDREISRMAFYATEDLRFLDDAFILNFGSRVTADNQFGVFTTSGVGARYNFGGEKGREPFGLRVNWSQSFKAPGLSQLYASFVSGATLGVPNSALQPELGVNYDIGLDIQLSPTALFRATYFRTDLTNAVIEGALVADLGTGANPRFISQTINAQATLSTGFELSFDWRMDEHWRIQVSDTILDTRPIGDPAADGLAQYVARGYFYQYQASNIPFNSTNFVLSYVSPGFNAAFLGRFSSERRYGSTNFYEGGYANFDVTFSLPLTGSLTLNGGVFNVFNANFLERPSVFFVAPPTNFKIGLTATF